MSQTLYPTHEDFHETDGDCPNCGHTLWTTHCDHCGGEGGHDGYEDDPNFYHPGEIIPCGLCQGQGHHCWCPLCRWDANLPDKWNRPEHRQMAVLCVTIHAPE